MQSRGRLKIAQFDALPGFQATLVHPGAFGRLFGAWLSLRPRHFLLLLGFLPIILVVLDLLVELDWFPVELPPE